MILILVKLFPAAGWQP